MAITVPEIQAIERALLRILVELLVAREAGAETNGLAQGIEGVELVADDARDLEVKRVRSEIDCGERGIYRHVSAIGLPQAARAA